MFTKFSDSLLLPVTTLVSYTTFDIKWMSKVKHAHVPFLVFNEHNCLIALKRIVSLHYILTNYLFLLI